MQEILNVHMTFALISSLEESMLAAKSQSQSKDFG